MSTAPTNRIGISDRLTNKKDIRLNIGVGEHKFWFHLQDQMGTPVDHLDNRT